MEQVFSKDMTEQSHNNKQSNQRYENTLLAGNEILERAIQSKESYDTHHTQKHTHSHDHGKGGNHENQTDHKHKIHPDPGQSHNHEDKTRSKSRIHHDHGQSHNHEDETLSNTQSLPTSVWLASIASIIVISLVGLGAVAAIPLLQGPHQDSLLQLLVSLAIGTLVGDALIHLLPHALQTGHGDTSVVWKGFVATMTIIVLFVVDQLMGLFGHGHSHGHAHALGHAVEDSTSQDVVSYKTLNIEEKGDIIDREGGCPEEKEKLTLETSDFGSAPSSYFEEDAFTPKPVPYMSNSARMVIVGDAIHNFADGLAIGAAFSISIAAGFSTSLAVLCHELPHEVGDFALLLHSGMPTKTAVLFNIVSSVFAVLGMVVGLLLWSSGQFSSWLLASTVGVFVYVALVSMMSEIGGGGGLKNLILNTGGMVAGALLLLMIGLYEHDLIYFIGGDEH